MGKSEQSIDTKKEGEKVKLFEEKDQTCIIRLAYKDNISLLDMKMGVRKSLKRLGKEILCIEKVNNLKII